MNSDSVAVGFIFELDDVLYGQLLRYQRRCKFETEDARLHPPRRATVLAKLVRQNRRFGVYTFCSLIAVIDLVCTVLVYLHGVGVLPWDNEPDSTFWNYTVSMLRWQVMARALVFALAELMTAWIARLDEPKTMRCTLGFALLPMVLVAFVAYVYAYTFATCTFSFGFNSEAVSEDPTLRACTGEKDHVEFNATANSTQMFAFDSTKCKNLHNTAHFVMISERFTAREKRMGEKLFSAFLCEAFAGGGSSRCWSWYNSQGT